MNYHKSKINAFYAILIILSVIVLPGNGFSEEEAKKKKEGEGFKEKYNVEFVAVPLIMFNPNFGNGGGAVVMTLFDMDPENDDLQSSSLSLAGIYSDRQSHFLALGGQFFPSRYWRYKAGVVGGSIKSELDVDILPTRADISNNINAFVIEAQYGVAENIFAGVKTVTTWLTYSPDNDAGREYLALMGAEDDTSLSVGPVMSYDTRDNRFYPYSGILSELSCMFYSKDLGSDVNYHVLEGFLNGYKQYIPKHVIAGRLYGRFTPDQAPYSGLSTLGQKADLRGYVAGEYVANNLVTIQVEYRWQFYEKFALVGFIGEAALFNNGDLDSDSFYLSGGGGLRYTLSEERGANFKVDFAWGEGNSDGLYVGINEAF